MIKRVTQTYRYYLTRVGRTASARLNIEPACIKVLDAFHSLDAVDLVMGLEGASDIEMPETDGAETGQKIIDTVIRCITPQR